MNNLIPNCSLLRHGHTIIVREGTRKKGRVKMREVQERLCEEKI